MKAVLRKALTTRDYAALEELLAHPHGVRPDDLRDDSLGHFLIAAMLESESPAIAKAVLNAHYDPGGCFLLDSINAPSALLLMEAKAHPNFIGHAFGQKVKEHLDDGEAKVQKIASEREKSIARADSFLNVVYQSLQDLCPQIAEIAITNSFMVHSPLAQIPKGSRYPGTFEFNHRLLRSLGVSDEVIRLRNREIIDTQLSIGTPDKFVLSLCQGTDKFDFEYLVKLMRHESKSFKKSGVITAKDGARRDIALHLASVCPWDQPKLLAEAVRCITPKALQSVSSGASSSEIMGALIDQIESPTVIAMLIRKVADNHQACAKDIAPLIRSARDFDYVRDLGRFDLHDLMENAQPSILAHQLETDLGM